MKSYVWNDEKNKLLQNERCISFEDIVDAISNGYLLDSIKNPSSEKYSSQSVAKELHQDVKQGHHRAVQVAQRVES